MARRINQESTGHGVNELNERKRRVLWAVVQDYADTAEPVGSRFRHVPEDFFLTVHMIHQHVVDHVLLFRRNRSGLHQPVHIETVSFDRRDATRGGMRLLKVAFIL